MKRSRRGRHRVLSQHFKRNGRPKKSLTKGEAAVEALRHRDMSYYLCDFCEAWHVGH